MRKFLILVLLLNNMVTFAKVRQPGILIHIQNANIRTVQNIATVNRAKDGPVGLTFQTNMCVGISREDSKWYILPVNGASKKISTNTGLWVLPQDPFSKDKAYFIKLTNRDSAVAVTDQSRLKVTVYSKKFELQTSEARPHSDCFNNRYTISIKSGDSLANTLAGFYWGTMLQSVVEKTREKNNTYSSGYVVSTLNPKAYAGSYPDVDHEFQIKGRLAFGSELDIDVVKRMIALQFKLMADDPEGLFRAPCSVQPSGEREYHIRRNSQNGKVNADMFLLTGNIEILEESFRLFEATKDRLWLKSNIENLEKAAAFTIFNIDQYGRVWSDVYYEDQVMKDGRETMSGALAAYTFKLLAQMETVLGRDEQSAYYSEISKKISRQLVRPLPQGFWDENKQRFTDWVDRSGVNHDHIHLLANILPVMLGYTTASQSDAVSRLVSSKLAEFQRFPSFLSADIAAYDNSEIGDGGPYDLCAAGRYWWWDASYWKWSNDNLRLYKQLKLVAGAAYKDSFYMGERYDMNHVYYIDDKDWHGADKYYEYPCVYTSVLIDNYLGLRYTLDADLSIKPNLEGYGTVEFTNPLYNIRYTVTAKGFSLKNLSGKPRRFAVDLSGIFKNKLLKRIARAEKDFSALPAVIELAANEEANWVTQ